MPVSAPRRKTCCENNQCICFRSKWFQLGRCFMLMCWKHLKNFSEFDFHGNIVACVWPSASVIFHGGGWKLLPVTVYKSNTETKAFVWVGIYHEGFLEKGGTCAGLVDSCVLAWPTVVGFCFCLFHSGSEYDPTLTKSRCERMDNPLVWFWV